MRPVRSRSRASASPVRCGLAISRPVGTARACALAWLQSIDSLARRSEVAGQTNGFIALLLQRLAQRRRGPGHFLLCRVAFLASSVEIACEPSACALFSGLGLVSRPVGNCTRLRAGLAVNFLTRRSEVAGQTNGFTALLLQRLAQRRRGPGHFLLCRVAFLASSVEIACEPFGSRRCSPGLGLFSRRSYSAPCLQGIDIYAPQ